MHQQYILISGLALTICLCISCRSIEASFPDIEKVEIEELTPRESVMNVQIEVNMDPIMKLVEKNTPKTFKGVKKACEGVSYNYHFSRKPIQFKTMSQEINYTISGDFELQMNYCPLCVTLLGNSSCTIPRFYGSCGVNEPRRRYAMTYGTSLSLSNNYSLTSKTKLKYFKIKDPCEITFINYDVTDKVKKEIETELKAMEKDIDKMVSEINLKSKIDSVWRELKNPFVIEPYGFLHINPRRISMGDIEYINKRAYFALNIFFSPFLSTQREFFDQEPLEEMQAHQQVKGFAIIADLKVDYDSLSSILTKEFYNHTFLVKNKPVVVKGLTIVGTNANQLVFRIEFDGFRKGTFYMTGTPEIDSINQVLSFKDIDFEIKTRSFLLKSSQWLLSKRVINEIQQKATIDLSSMLDNIKVSLKDKLTGEIGDGVHSETSINELKVLKLLLSSEYIAIRTSLRGDIKIRIE